MSSFDLDLLFRSQDLQLATRSLDKEWIQSSEEVLIWTDPTGPMTISRLEGRQTSSYRLRLGDEIAVDVSPGACLSVRSQAGIPQSTVNHFLADQVLPRMLSERDDLVLHAGAIRDYDGALLLLGTSGSGKSTLVTSFQQSGWMLMGDDAAVLSLDDRGAAARAVYSSLRLFPDAIEALFLQGVASRDMAHYSSKQRLDVVTSREETDAIPVKAMFVLGENDDIAVRRLSAAQACMAIVENCFTLDPMDARRASQRLRRATCFASEMPAYSISYPREFSRLRDVREAIQSAVAADAAVLH